MPNLELRFPPVAVSLVVGALMWLGAWAAPALGFGMPLREGVAIGCCAVGVVVAVLGVVSFRRAGTTVHPLEPGKTSALVVSGIYRVTRNPMYLGLLLLLAGWASYLGNAMAFLIAPLFVLYMNRFQIGPEERALASMFGEKFTTYKARVRRWL